MSLRFIFYFIILFYTYFKEILNIPIIIIINEKNIKWQFNYQILKCMEVLIVFIILNKGVWCLKYLNMNISQLTIYFNEITRLYPWVVKIIKLHIVVTLMLKYMYNVWSTNLINTIIIIVMIIIVSYILFKHNDKIKKLRNMNMLFYIIIWLQ